MIDIEKLEALAKAAGGDAWTPTYAGRTTLATVWLPDGDSVCQCHGNIGHQPEPIDADDVAEYIGAVSPANVLALIEEVRALREDAELFRLLVSTCDALDANAFDASNQPGTIRMTLKHKTRTYPELQMKIIDFLKGYKTRVDAARGAQ